MVLAAATLVDFSGFQDVHEVIFDVVNARYGPSRSRHDPEEWEIYVKYRQLLSEFLTDQRRSGALFVETVHYLKLAEYLVSFLIALTNVLPALTNIQGEVLMGK